MEKQLVIGLDLSFNSTGISIMECENHIPKKIKFYRIVFDDESNKTGKIYHPKDIPNINQIIYRMPTNIRTDDVLLDASDKNNTEQTYTTLRAMICSKKINKIIGKEISEYKPDIIICTIENYVMPSFAGPNSLKSVSGLILLQGFVREFLIRTKITIDTNKKFNDYNLKDLYIYTPTPTQNKSYFSGNGKAEKTEMIKTFETIFEGNRLLPNLNHGKVDDIIDSFALLTHGWYIYLKKEIWKK